MTIHTLALLLFLSLGLCVQDGGAHDAGTDCIINELLGWCGITKYEPIERLNPGENIPGPSENGEMVSIIVVFTHALSDDEYNGFVSEMDKLFQAYNGDTGGIPGGYKITNVYTVVFNGVSIWLPSGMVKEVEKIPCVAAVHPDEEVTTDPVKDKTIFLK